MLALFFMLLAADVIIERCKPAPGPSLHELYWGDYVDNWPLLRLWCWRQVSAPLVDYSYDEERGILRVVAGGFKGDSRRKVFWFRVEQLPESLLRELASAQNRFQSGVQFRHFATLLNDSRDDSGGELTVFSPRELDGYRYVFFGLRDGSRDLHMEVSGRLWGCVMDMEQGLLRLEMGPSPQDSISVELELNPDRLPPALRGELDAAVERSRTGSEPSSFAKCLWHEMDEGKKRILVLTRHFPEGSKKTWFELVRGEQHVLDEHAEGRLVCYTFDEHTGALEVAIAADADGPGHTVCLESCTFSPQLRDDLKAIQHSSESVTVSCWRGRSDGLETGSIHLWPLAADELGGAVERRYDLRTGKMVELRRSSRSKAYRKSQR